MGRFQRLPKETVLEAIRGSGGTILPIMTRLGLKNWKTCRKLVLKWQETKEAFEAEAEITLDVAEAQVRKAIYSGDLGTAKWYLAKKGKDRGYADDLPGMNNDEPLKIEFSGGVTRQSMESDPNVIISNGIKEESTSGTSE